MSKVYITSKSKTFKEGSEIDNIARWISENVDHEIIKRPYDIIRNEATKKIKITITNLK